MRDINVCSFNGLNFYQGEACHITVSWYSFFLSDFITCILPSVFCYSFIFILFFLGHLLSFLHVYPNVALCKPMRCLVFISIVMVFNEQLWMLILLIVSAPECHNKRANWKKNLYHDSLFFVKHCKLKFAKF